MYTYELLSINRYILNIAITLYYLSAVTIWMYWLHPKSWEIGHCVTRDQQMSSLFMTLKKGEHDIFAKPKIASREVIQQQKIETGDETKIENL